MPGMPNSRENERINTSDLAAMLDNDGLGPRSLKSARN
jgi:hypothetical protein